MDDNENNVNVQNADTIFDICKSEYEYEKNRTSTIDSKAAIIASLTAVFLVWVIELLNYKDIFSYTIETVGETIYFFCLFILYTGSLVLSLISFILLIKTIATQKYASIDPEYFLEAERLKVEKGAYKIVCAHFYKDAVLENREVNDKRVKFYQKSLWLLLSSILSLITYFIINSFS